MSDLTKKKTNINILGPVEIWTSVDDFDYISTVVMSHEMYYFRILIEEKQFLQW